MSHAIMFDTLAFAKKLESSGMQIKHAEGVAEAMRDVFEEKLSPEIFTKEDGKILKSELKSDITEIRAELFKVKSELIAWMVGLLFAQTAIMISIIKFIH